MKTLYQASNAVEAHMLRDLLQQEGIETHIHGEALQGAMGEIPAAGLVRLVVEDEQYAPARAIIDRWEGAQADSPPTPKPARKSLGASRFLLGLVIGVGATYAAYKTPATSDGADYDGDGKLDEKWTFSPNGSPLKLEVDRNLDRKVDLIVHYARGLMESAESDDNFDGVFESKQRYRNNSVEVAESDTNGDGNPDIRQQHASGVLETIEFVNPMSGLPLKVEHYRLGKLDFADLDSDKDGTLDVRIKYDALAEIASREPLPK